MTAHPMSKAGQRFHAAMESEGVDEWFAGIMPDGRLLVADGTVMSVNVEHDRDFGMGTAHVHLEFRAREMEIMDLGRAVPDDVVRDEVPRRPTYVLFRRPEGEVFHAAAQVIEMDPVRCVTSYACSGPTVDLDKVSTPYHLVEAATPIVVEVADGLAAGGAMCDECFAILYRWVNLGDQEDES